MVSSMIDRGNSDRIHTFYKYISSENLGCVSRRYASGGYQRSFAVYENMTILDRKLSAWMEYKPYFARDRRQPDFVFIASILDNLLISIQSVYHYTLQDITKNTLWFVKVFHFTIRQVFSGIEYVTMY